MVLWRGHPVWSTLPRQDCVALHHFAHRALLPHVEGDKVGGGCDRVPWEKVGMCCQPKGEAEDVLSAQR